MDYKRLGATSTSVRSWLMKHWPAETTYASANVIR